MILLAFPLATAAQTTEKSQSTLVARLEVEQTAARAEAVAWAAERALPADGYRAGRAFYLTRLAGQRPVYLTTHNSNAAQVTRTTALHPGGTLGLDLDGAGLALGIWDAGTVRLDHQEFAGRLTLLDNVPNDFHATHVGGTLAAAGVRPQAQGMAFAADLRSYDWAGDLTEMANEARRGLLLSNHSYGPISGWAFGAFNADETEGWYWFGDPAISTTEDHMFGRYDEDAALFDEVAYAHPYLLPVISAGNDRSDTGPNPFSNTNATYFSLDTEGNWVEHPSSTLQPQVDGNRVGFDTIAGAATAKNVLTVGSVGVTRNGGSFLSQFSSNGPTDDGRIKPDLVGSGETVFSTSNSSAVSYAYSTGTSMATGNVTGSLALLQQHHFRLRGRYLRAASIKALAIHTARDLGLPGPDYRYGWGLLDAASAIYHLESALTNPIALVEGLLTPSAPFTRTLRADNARSVRITIAWDDPPPPVREVRGPADLDDPTPRLVYDLDIRLIEPSTGQVFLPYAPNLEFPDDEAPQADNTRDNIEQIYVPVLPLGSYHLEVRHKGTLPQAHPFTLLVSGLADEAPLVSLGPFDGSASPGTAVLTWETLREAASGTFVIERLPLTLRPGLLPEVGAATRIGELEAEGESASRRTYQFTDPSVSAGWHRYRLFFEQDGIPTLLGSVDVRVPAPEALVLRSYPNPSAGLVTLQLDLPRETPVTITVFDMLGRTMHRLEEQVLQAGRASVLLDGTSWVPGVYLVQVATRLGTRTHRLVIAR